MCEEDKKAEPPKDIAAELMSAVTYVYLNPIEGYSGRGQVRTV